MWVDFGDGLNRKYVTQWDASDVLSNFTFSLTDASNNFEINRNTGEITVAATNTLDYESNTAHNVNVTVTDASGQSYVETMTISVDNRAEVNQTVPGAQTVNEDGLLTFSAGNTIPNAVTVSDTLAGTDSPSQVSMSVNDGILTLSGLTGIRRFVEGGNGQTRFVINGTESDLNAALEGMTFDSDADFNGAVTLNMTTAFAADLQKGHYTFDGGNATDEAPGTANDGTFFDNATTTIDGTRGGVLWLDGIDDYVTSRVDLAIRPT